MKITAILAATMICSSSVAEPEGKEQTLRLTLESTQSRMLVRESLPLRSYLVNSTNRPVEVPASRMYVQLDIRINNAWTSCDHGVHEGDLPSYFRAPWQTLAAGDRMQAHLPDRQQCLCKQPAGGSQCEEWFSRPGTYELRVRAALHHDNQNDQATTEASQLVSNNVTITLVEPSGPDAEVYAWATEHGTLPTAPDVVARFPNSTYAAAMLSHYVCATNDVHPQEVVRQLTAKRFPPLLSVPDLTSNGELRNLGGIEAARWRAQQAERLLRKDFNLSATLRMELMQALGVNLVAMGEQARGLSILGEIAKSAENSRQARWAQEFLAQYRSQETPDVP